MSNEPPGTFRFRLRSRSRAAHRHVVGPRRLGSTAYTWISRLGAPETLRADTVDTCQRIGYVPRRVSCRVPRLSDARTDSRQIGIISVENLKMMGFCESSGSIDSTMSSLSRTSLVSASMSYPYSEFESYHRSVLARCGGDMLEVLHRVECVLERFWSHSARYPFCTRSRVHRDHHDGILVSMSG